MNVRTLSKVLVEVHEEKHVTHRGTRERRGLVAQLEKLGLPVTVCNGSLPVDVMWSVDGEPVMFDLKTPQDFIASAEDGRLHKQLTSMEERGCSVYGFVLEGCESADGGVTVGYGTHAWAHERFDNLVVSLQREGATIVRSSGPARTPTRLASLYRWTGKVERASWRAPKPPSYSLNRLYGDKAYRAAVEGLMALLPGCGEERAVALLDTYTLEEVLRTDCDWSKVQGVGAKLTSAWKRTLEGDYRVQYHSS